MCAFGTAPSAASLRNTSEYLATAGISKFFRRVHRVRQVVPAGREDDDKYHCRIRTPPRSSPSAARGTMGAQWRVVECVLLFACQILMEPETMIDNNGWYTTKGTLDAYPLRVWMPLFEMEFQILMMMSSPVVTMSRACVRCSSWAWNAPDA